MSGTSMAAPHVAGVVALMQSAAHAPLAPGEVRNIIQQTARAFAFAPDFSIGPGIVDAAAAVNAAKTRQAHLLADFKCAKVYKNDMIFSCSNRSTDDSGTIISSEWNYGDGRPGVASTAAPFFMPYFLYALPGLYKISLTVKDDNGNADTAVQAVAVDWPQMTPLVSGQPVTGLQNVSPSYDVQYFYMDVPAGSTDLIFKAFSDTPFYGIVYVGLESHPLSYPGLCEAHANQAWVPDTQAVCTVSAPEPGRYYVGLSPFQGMSFSEVSLIGSYAR